MYSSGASTRGWSAIFATAPVRNATAALGSPRRADTATAMCDSFSWFMRSAKSATKCVKRRTSRSSPGAQNAGAATTSSSFSVSSCHSRRECSSASSPSALASSGRVVCSSAMNCAAAMAPARSAAKRAPPLHTRLLLRGC